MISKVYRMLLVSCMMIGCRSYQKINGDSAPILMGNTLPLIKILLEKANIDTSYNLQKISIDYTRYSKGRYFLIDKEHKWELNFSGNYPDIHIKYFDSNFVILYCPISGIMNGLTLFPSNHDDLFVIDRKQGKKMLDIQSKEGGITKAFIKDDFVYYEYYEPDVVRYVAINKR